MLVVVEKARHPRFHIGESLLPLNLPLFEQSGIADQVRSIGMPKYGVEFVSPYHRKAVSFEFAKAWDKSLTYSITFSATNSIISCSRMLTPRARM